jgi:hypothetical protein
MKQPLESRYQATSGNEISGANAKIARGGCGASAPHARPGHLAAPHKDARKTNLIDFDQINRAALAAFPTVLARILPGGRRVGDEYLVLNPRRADRHLGSFRINLCSGKWADFACDARGGDPISLVAYLDDVKQTDAARRLLLMLGIGGRR